MNKANIRSKIVKGFVAVTIFSLIIGAFSIVGNVIIEKKASSLYNETYMAAANLRHVQGNMFTIREIYFKMLSMSDASSLNENLAKVEEQFTELSEHLAQYSELDISDKEKKLYEEARLHLDDIGSIAAGIAEAMKSNDRAAAAAKFKELDASRSTTDKCLAGLIEANEADAANDFESARRAAFSVMAVTVVIAVLAIIAAVLFSRKTSYEISAPIHRFAEAGEALARGEFDIELSETGTEEYEILAESIMSIGASMNTMLEEADKLEKAAESGDLSVRGDVERLNGEYRTIVSGVNKTFEKLAGVIEKSSDLIEEISTGDFDREIGIDYPGAYGHIIDGLNRCIVSINSLVEESDKMVENAVEGRLRKRGDENRFTGKYKRIVAGVNHALDTLTGHIDEIPSPVMIINRHQEIQFLNQRGATILSEKPENVEGRKCYDCLNSDDCRTKECVCARAMAEDRNASNVTVGRPGGNVIDIGHTGVPIHNANGEIIGALEIMTNETASVKAAKMAEESKLLSEKMNAYQNFEVATLIDSLEQFASGKLLIEVDREHLPEGVVCDEQTEDIKSSFDRIHNALDDTTKNIRSYVSDITAVLAGISSGDLNQSVVADYKGDFTEIKESLNNILDSLNDVIGQINKAADEVAVGAREVSNGSQMLSQAATEQASSVEELNASIALIAEQTKQNALDAGKAQSLSKNVRDGAVAGNDQMKAMLQAMSDINTSSANISNIIKVIDDIAFQTNILALNAAVEAARAGVHGKGFAVVAEEVRNLAARSADAVKETTELIEGSIRNVQSGTGIANDTANALGKIVLGIEDSSNLVSNIAGASNEQASNIAQINKGIEQVAKVVQNISSTSEESASASEALSKQAEAMKNLVASFKIKENAERRLRIEGTERPALQGSGPEARNSANADSEMTNAGGKYGSQASEDFTTGGFEDSLHFSSDPMEGGFRVSQRIILSDDDYDKY
ncbi:MAG: MCP four helix bundle domain-containing protein [Clostridia bacterium]|nr:MCP four helix bundle domain-containing protein [Clostridia bacterium]